MRRQEGQKSQKRQGPPRVPLLPFLLFISACELTEVTVPPGQRTVVVQSVINRTEAQQYVVVEYSQTGDVRTSALYADPRIPPGFPKIPVRNATVTVEHEGAGACVGTVDTLLERPADALGTAPAAGVYSGPLCRLQPGDRLLLRVETPAGEVVTGAATVPGAAAQTVTAAGIRAAPGGGLVLNRELDTLEIGVAPTNGRALQVEVRQGEDPHRLAMFSLTDSMGIRFPGNLVNPLEGDSGESVFRAGRYYTLGVALTDTNYYDFVRSFTNPLTGRGFINHLTGGIGVFGSLETAAYRLRVVAPLNDPRDGVYRLTGTVGGDSVNVSLELYVDEVQRYLFSAFVRGMWWNGPIDLSADGFLPPGPGGEMDFHFSIPSGDTLAPTLHDFTGLRPAAGTAFPVIVTTYSPNQRAALVDTLTALQISGPAGARP